MVFASVLAMQNKNKQIEYFLTLSLKGIFYASHKTSGFKTRSAIICFCLYSIYLIEVKLMFAI